MKSKDEKWALFWCKLLHPVIFGEIEKRQTNQYLKTLSKQLTVGQKLAGQNNSKLIM